VSRDFDPNPGQWYEDLDREEVFKVVSVDPDEMLVRIQWPDREYEDLDLETWNELDLELAVEPEGWVDEAGDLDEEDEETSRTRTGTKRKTTRTTGTTRTRITTTKTTSTATASEQRAPALP